MNEAYPPLQLVAPEKAKRRSERPRLIPTPPEVIARRGEIAKRLREQIQPLAERVRRLSDEERRAIFVKLEHEGPIDVKKLGLKPIAEPTEHFTLAVPPPRTGATLNLIEKHVDKFETGEVQRGVVPSAQLARIQLIVEGDPKDRLSTEFAEQYEALIQKDLLVCEIEMLSIATGERQKRNELERIRHDLMRELGTQGHLFEHEEIRGTCRAVIRCTGKTFQRLVEAREWQTRITWFEARPEFQTFHQIVQDFSVDQLGAINPPRANAPLVCLVDTGVTAGNPFLRPITRADLLKSFLKKKPDDPTDEYGHGSGVASLVAYYALNLAPGGTNDAKVWITSARVLDEHNHGEEQLFSKALSEAVSFFAPLGVKIFNLSVNVRNRRWSRDAKRTVPRRSWIARKIDYLSRENDVVFVVSTGNILPIDVRLMIRDGQDYPAYFTAEDSCLLDPAQAALALTVGSMVPTTLAVGHQEGRARAIAELGQPSPFTRCGPGVNKDIKPELVDYGGNYLLDEEGGQVRHNYGVSVPMASNTLTPPVVYDAGTSFAAPRATHKLALIQRDLTSLDIQPSAALLKAFAVNSARYPLGSEELQAFATSVGEDNAKHWLNLYGYGMADAQRATDCDPYSAVLFFQGGIEPDNITFFDIPIPANLTTAESGKKRLTVTVVHMPEVQRWGLEQYLGTAVKWRMFRGDVSRDEVTTAMSMPDEEGEEQPDIPSELKFRPFGIQQRSRGTIQHDTYEWTMHKSDYSEHHYTLAVAAYEKWARTAPPPVPFAVVVRLEETTQSAEIYSKVQNALVALQVETNARL